jgi:hypothetical protein
MYTIKSCPKKKCLKSEIKNELEFWILCTAKAQIPDTSGVVTEQTQDKVSPLLPVTHTVL